MSTLGPELGFGFGDLLRPFLDLIRNATKAYIPKEHNHVYIYIYIHHYSDIYRYRYMNIDKEPSGIILNMGNISPWHKARTRAQGQGSDFLVR